MNLRIVLYCLLGGLPVTIAGMGAGHFGWWWASGVVLAAAFVPVALFGPQGALKQFGVIAPVLFIVTVLCTWSEALIFVPSFREHAGRDLVGSVVLYLTVAAVLALLAWVLKLAKPSEAVAEHRRAAVAAGMVLLCGFAYVVYYLVFGAITYQFFTKAYYPDAAKLLEPLGPWFWAIQLARGVLMTLAVVPVIYTLRMSRWQVAVVAGLLVWVAGGLAPLLVPNEIMGTTQRMIHVVEILTQNVLLGITAGLLLRPRPRPLASVSAAAA
jgi:uncharacterized membrane protein YwaF